MDLDNGPSASSPHPTPKEAPYAFEHVGDMSDLDESEPEDDLSPILDKVITIPIPQTPAESKELMLQAFYKRKIAAHKSELADAAVREALMKAKLCRSRAKHAKHVLGAANAYISHVRWTVRRSKHKMSKRVDRATAVTDPVVNRTKVNHFVNVPGGSMAISLD